MKIARVRHFTNHFIMMVSNAKGCRNIYCDTIPRTVSITGGRNSLMERLKLQVCELCGATDKLEMHHVRKLKDLKGKSDWEKKMIARRRKLWLSAQSVMQK